ncbi:aconitase family protein [Penicillium lagena]|uniref:aconitase family protein n=1 Tax=Penicillium lagena TaxID=94218 RepID=UPI002540B3CE|nr:aconitase family protein [Penicillium lagena]KAJ5610280.1 aconitase family protein [Penicillium lagena]
MATNDAGLLTLSQRISHVLQTTRGIHIESPVQKKECDTDNEELAYGNFVAVLDAFINLLKNQDKPNEADAIQRTKDIALESKSHGGLQIDLWKALEPSACDALAFWVEAWLQSLSSAEKSRQLLRPLSTRPVQRRGMTLTEKILAHHSVDPIASNGLTAGDFVRVTIDWVAASEISYFIWRNDRFWIAGDHVVDPRTYNTPLNRRLIKATDKAAQDFKLTDYKGPNYTIMHTEFVRERAEPGLLILGSDSHTCSSGAVGCLAVGLGAADVAMSVITGETWFQVPECISIQFVGQPQLGIGGKDIILYILGELKRNTVAAEKVVEFSGPGCRHLSVDARFAIANMCTEFGAITGLFVPDDIVQTYVSGRKQKYRRSSSTYFQPDTDAVYSGTYEIDLSKVTPLLAIYPSPDDVVPVTEKEGMHLDGCFIGACTTTEEDLILAALVLDVGLRRNLPLAPGKRHVAPGSIPIRSRLEALGFLDTFKEAGFSIGVPGCSYCVGMGADQAGEGEVWISSQNRNFQNRMGKGSIGNLSSAATVAASSFEMKVTDPSSFLSEIEASYFNAIKSHPKRSRPANLVHQITDIAYVEPNYDSSTADIKVKSTTSPQGDRGSANGSNATKSPIKEKVIRLGDFVDTDAIAPADCLVTATTDEALGDHCMKYVMPEFRQKVRGGQKVLVAGKALGVGSSREAAVRALKGLGVQCVIARSFAFIFNRNLPNLGILRFTIDDDNFYELAVDGAEIQISLDERQIQIGGSTFYFQLSDMELALIENQGMTNAYQKFGSDIFQSLASGGKVLHKATSRLTGAEPEVPAALRDLQW